MSQFVVKDTSNGNTRECESRAEAEETKNDLVSLGADPTQIEIIAPGKGENTAPTAAELQAEETGKAVETHEAPDNVVDKAPEPADNFEDELPDKPPVDTDPLTWIPDGFQDTIDGTIAINRKGFEVLSHFYDVDVFVDLETPPEETGFEYARVKARAVTADGRECEAYGSAHVDRGDDHDLLLEMADTRARKRALSVATGVGAVAVEELQAEVRE